MAASTNLGPDVVIGGGDWLFRQGEMVLGPVPAQQIVAKLYSGELSGSSEIAPLGQNRFRPLGQEPFFKVHLAKAEAKLRVDALAQAERSRASRSRNTKIAIVALVALLVAIGAASAARYLAIHNPLKSEDAYADISMEPPVIGRAHARKSDEELVDYPAGGTSTGTRRETSTSRSGGSRSERAVASRASASQGGGKLNSASEDPDGMQTAQFDRSAINAVVASKQRTLYGCLSDEARRNPSIAGQKIPIEFVIGNDGHVSKLWVDNPAFKTGPLADCMLGELRKWPFKPYEGEQATVGLSFKVGGKS